MMRSRIIRPDFFEDEDLAELEPLTRLLFIGLWCLADREGRLEERIRHFRAELFRFDDVITCQDIQRHVLALSSPHPFIVRYTIDNKQFIQIPNFKKYQHVHPHEKRSTIPAPPDVITCHVMSGALTSTSTSKEPLPLVETLKAKRSKRASQEWDSPEQAGWFTEWYGVYPRRIAKVNAQRAFRKHITSRALCDQAIEAVRLRAGGLDNSKPEFYPYPASWLNQKPWEDMGEPEPIRLQPKPTAKTKADYEAEAAMYRSFLLDPRDEADAV
jgi:hypothetical protein